MRIKPITKRGAAIALATVLLFMLPIGAEAVVEGVSGTSFTLTAKAGYISSGEGGVVYTWGYAVGAGNMQYPGPTLIISENDVAPVTITLNNELSVPVSIVFPGQRASATGGQPGLLTREAAPGGSVTYSFVPSEPGTYIYHSGTNPALQVEMGLVGAIVIRPSMGANYAYNHADTRFDHEYLFLVTQMDPDVHESVEYGQLNSVDLTAYWPVYWFLNGRTAPDTLLPSSVAWLPNQPYNCLPRMHPGEKVLLRLVGGSRSMHPFHTHGNNFVAIARDGRMFESQPGVSGPDLGVSDFTQTVVPGETVDALFTWTGKDLGWDIYGDPASAEFVHACNDTNGDGFDDNSGPGGSPTWEWCADHGKPFPVILPDNKDLTFGGWWSGSPFLGAFSALPPGEGGLNVNGGLFFMWHSHTEKELTNNDIFPGGMMTLLIVEPHGVPIP